MSDKPDPCHSIPIEKQYIYRLTRIENVAMGHISSKPLPECTYEYSEALQAVYDLRIKYDAAISVLKKIASCQVNAPGDVVDLAKKFIATLPYQDREEPKFE